MLEHSQSRMTIVLVGNKADLQAERQVSQAEGQAFAARYKLMFYETSAKTGENVEKVFTDSARTVYDNIKAGNVYDLTEGFCSGVRPSAGVMPAAASYNDEDYEEEPHQPQLKRLNQASQEANKDSRCC